MSTKEHLKSWNIIFEDYGRKYPHLFERTVDWYEYKSNRIVVILEDNTEYVYNFITQSLSKLYPDNEFSQCTTEDEWRLVFANNLKFKMMERFIGQNELCEITGISQVSMSRYMNGKAFPNLYNLQKIGRALRCPTEELTGEMEEM